VRAVSLALREELWSSVDGLFKKILDHPFVTGLTDGTLPREAFQHYVLQDAHYLRSYAKALAVCSSKAIDERDITMFAEHAAEAILVERSLHAGFIADFGLSEAQAAAVTIAPTTLAYTSYLLAATHNGSFAEAVGAVLPCYWIYAEVGAALLEKSSPDPLYARWIATYGGEEFTATVEAVLALTDRLGERLGAAEVEAMRQHFVATSRYEWMFWDAAWRGESWPV
jgi:thiaminase/transcriptional activator TenA